MATTRKQKNGKAGRPRNEYTPDQERAVEQAARVNCTYEEIADISGISERSLRRDFAATIERIRNDSKESLRRAQFKAAIEGNPTMLIWLGKQWLSQSDKQQIEHGGQVNIVNIDWVESATYAVDNDSAETDADDETDAE